MVLYDFSEQQEQKKSIQFAPPHQRIVASFVDLLLLYPASFLLVSPLVRQIREEFLQGTPYALLVSFVSSLLFVNLIFLFMMTFSFLVFQATPGQKLFSLRVRSFHKDRLTLGQALQRSFGWILSLMLLGIPLIEVLTHRFRLVFYERMSETYVETLEKKWLVFPPVDFEILFGRWVFGMTLGFFSILGFAQWSGWVKEQMQNAVLYASEQGELCSELNPEFIDREKRLNLALVLGYANKEKASCFEQEFSGFWFKHSEMKQEITKVPEMQMTLHHFMSFKDMKYSEYADFCNEESQVCLLLQYLELKRNKKSSSITLSKSEIVEKLRLSADRILLTDWILFQEDMKAKRFLPALSRLNELEKTIGDEAEDLAYHLENDFIQLAWSARDSQAEPSGPQLRLPASIAVDSNEGELATTKRKKTKKELNSSEAITVITAFKERFEID